MSDWEVSKSFNGNYNIDQKSSKTNTGFMPIADVYSTESDARLMAAAPDMLQALEDTQEKLQKLASMESDAYSYRYAHICDCIETIKIAIAKTKGEPNAN